MNINKDNEKISEEEMIDFRITKKAGLFKRGIAFIIDLIIVNILYFLLILVGYEALNIALERNNISWPSQDLILVILFYFFFAWFIFFLIYFTFFLFYGGQTPAKMLFRMKVISSNGQELSFSRSFVRASCYFVSFIFFIFSFIMGLFHKDKKTLHDLIANTNVIYIHKI